MSTFEFPDELQSESTNGGVAPAVTRDVSNVAATVDEPPKPRQRHRGGVVEMPIEERRSKRISVPIGDDGQIEWDKIKSSNLPTFKAALKNDKEVSDLFSKEHIELLTIETASAFVDAIGKINSFVFMKVFKLHPSIAIKYFSYSKEHHERIDPRAQAVANKYRDKLPTWITKYQEEIQLGAVCVQIGKEQLQGALMEQRALIEQMAAHENQQPQYRGNGGMRVEAI